MSSDQFRTRVDAVRQRVDIVQVVGAAVALNHAAKPRGKCPFHGSKSDSLVVDPGHGTARCYGCDWGPRDAIGFVMDHYGLGFVDALERLESEHGLDGVAAAPVRREKAAVMPARRGRESVGSAVMARWIWRTARPNPAAIRTYYRARGVPEAQLGPERFGDLRFHPEAPIFPWPVVIGAKGPVRFDAPPRGCLSAPAIVALVRRPVGAIGEDGVRRMRFDPIGLHVTWLSPSLEGKMERRGADGNLLAARKMLGPTGGGCVLLGCYRPDCRLYVGEGIETVLSGLALADASADDVALAVLSLGNLEGYAKRWKNGALPLYAIEPDPERPPALAFHHEGPVVGLMDADMAPLRGLLDRETGERGGMLVVEERGARPVRRPISSFERTRICADLFAAAWRRAGCRRVSAMRPHMGQDCNDAVRELEGVGA